MLDRLWNVAHDALPLAAPILALTDAVPKEMPWGSLTASGLLGWYLWYNTRHGIPALVDRHAQTVAQLNQQFLDLLEKHRQDHAEDLQRIDAIRRDEQSRFLEAIGSLNKTIAGLSCQVRHVESNTR